METISVRDMQILDINCEYFGLSRIQLMESAGKSVADEIKKRFTEKNIAIFAGSGNNGGDSFVAARHLKNFNVEIYVVTGVKNIKSDLSRKNLEILSSSGYKIKEGFPDRIDADIIIDGMLGTGIKGKPREPYLSAIKLINNSDSYVIAIDLPSGLDADTGDFDEAVKADLTITFHKLKRGMLKAKELCGEIIVKDIGIPNSFENRCGVGDLLLCYKREKLGHKGSHGRVLVIGGGDYTGAPAISSLAAYAAGADIVTTVVPKNIRNIVASFSPNLIVRSVEGKRFSLRNINEISKLIKKHNVVLIGIGVGENEEFAEFVSEILKYCSKAVLDAEGIIDDIPEDVECIITPHVGEFKRVFGDPDREYVKKVAKRLGCTILLKGPEDFITNGTKWKVNKTGNPGMTVGGTGDVLSGVTAALFCNDSDFYSACASAFVNGIAGEICYEDYGYNFTAIQLISKLPIAFKRCLNFLH